MKQLLLVIIFLSINIENYSQCSTNLLISEGNSKVYGASLENLYTYAGVNDNGDLAQGAYLVNGQLIVFSTLKEGNLFTQWQLTLTVKSIYFDPLVPRQVRISFDNGNAIDLVASEFRQKEGHQICDFELTNSQITNFDSGISNISVMDSRQNKKIAKVPEYKYILREQKKCLMERL